MRKPGQDRKSEIVRAALELSFKVGPDLVTTGMIAQELGLTQPAIYKHFPKKADIWQAVSEFLATRIADNIVTAKARGSTSKDCLHHLVMLHLELMHDVPALPDIMLMRNPDGAKSQLQTHMQISMAAYRQALVENSRNAIETGQLRPELDAEDVATLIIGIAQSLALRMLVSRDPNILVPNGQRLLDLLLTSLTQKGET